MKPSLVLFGLAAAVGLLFGATQADAQTRAYATSGDCGGRPATTVRMAPGTCLGLIWQGAGAEGPRMPRGLMPLADGDWLVTDLGGYAIERHATLAFSKSTAVRTCPLSRIG